MSDSPNPIQMQKYLGGIEYPANRDAIVSHAEGKGADEETLSFLRSMPAREYDGPNAVSSEFSSASP